MTSLQILEADMGYEQWYLGNKDAFSTSSRKGMGGTKIWDIYTHSWILTQFTTCHQAFLRKWYFNTKSLNFWDIFFSDITWFPRLPNITAMPLTVAALDWHVHSISKLWKYMLMAKNMHVKMKWYSSLNRFKQLCHSVTRFGSLLV